MNKLSNKVIVVNISSNNKNTSIIPPNPNKRKDPLRYLWCQILITILGLRNRIKILYGNFFNKDLSEATLVTCYLLQDTNNILEDKLMSELRPNTKVVSNSFTFSFPKIGQDGDARLYRIPKHMKYPVKTW